MALPLSRRGFLSFAIGAVSAPEWQHYPDPATELDVIRLTDPAFPSGMTAPHQRQFTRRTEMLLCWSERTGTRQAFLQHLRTGESLQLTDVPALDTTALSLAFDERSFTYFDGSVLYQSPIEKPSGKEIYRVPEGATRTGFTAGADGSLVFAERANGKTRVVRLLRAQTKALFEQEAELTELSLRPGGQRGAAQLLYRQSGSLWVAGADGGGRRALKLQPGGIGEALWVPSGRTIIYLHLPEQPRELIALREHNPDTGEDTLVASTSQYISVAANADASVFVAASGSVASPYVLILVRAVRRELTLCEHHASIPAIVNPAFTPDSRSVVFVSDRHGKPAIYQMPVARFVEETSVDEEPPAEKGRGSRH